jgi:hypothetical protein
MKTIKTLALLAVVAATFTGCAMTAPTEGSIGMGIYTNVTEPFATGPNQGSGSLKRGEASATNILGIVAMGDYSISTAAANGGIKSIKSVDINVTNILGLFGKTTTIVYGE